LIGRTLSHFRILAKVGEGGMGVVYRAEDEKLRRQVALKVLPPDLVGNEERRLRFLREARAAAAVAHPNIATIYEVGEADGVVFIAMELVEGKSLRALIAGRPLPVKEAVRIAVGIAEGLARAHQSHVIHRDLKPENIVLGADGLVKILDFGLAKLLEEPDPLEKDRSRLQTISGEMTRQGKIMGTAAYMSPEQARGDVVDARSDLFSFGVVLYEMVTGRAPFQGRTGTDVLSAVLRDQPVPAAKLNPEAPPELDRIIGECLEKDPQDRCQHADQLAVDLRRLKRATDSGVRPAATPAPGRRRLHVILGASAALALGIGLALLWWMLRPGTPPGQAEGGAPAGEIRSIAVLPFENLSGDPEQEYFADGMTEELIADLARIGTLRVISRTSVMTFKGTRKPLPEIARALNVDAVVEASVRRSGQRVRITAQLVEAATDRHLWADSYEDDLRDILTLQSNVARAIAGQIKIKLTPQEERRLADTRPVSPEAHEGYLKGRFYWNKRTQEGFKRAVTYFQQAIDEDPTYARAYTGLADSYCLLPQYVFVSTADVLPKTRAAAARALEFDPDLAEAHASMACAHEMEWDWAAGEMEYKRAIELNPSYATAHHWYGINLSLTGRFEEGLREMQLAEELDPLSLIIKTSIAGLLRKLGRLDEAIAKYREALEIDPGFVSGHTDLGWTYEHEGLHEEALAEFRRALSVAPGNLNATAGLGYVLARTGNKTEAETILRQLSERSRSAPGATLYLAIVELGLGNKDGCFAWLEKAFVDRAYGEFVEIRGDLRFASVRQDPRFKDLLRRMGLEPY
jgi:serine/threonine-protein kinase